MNILKTAKIKKNPHFFFHKKNYMQNNIFKTVKNACNYY